MTDSSSIYRQLEEKLGGIRPSAHWQSACEAFLRQEQAQGRAIEADAVMQQILHADLRDVIRPVGNNIPANQSPYARLRRAMQQSQPPPNNNSAASSSKQTLDASFKILVQVEEVLDVSKNAEARLELGPASQNAPTPVGNQRNRLLKLCCTDGFDDGRPIIVMEESPIPNLSVNTLAGCKILLFGPITVRWGVLICHEGNAAVLGGYVDALVEMQQHALQQAKQVAGVGIDPTIRALIGTTPPDLEEEEQHQDEGEGASGDVVMAPAPMTTTTTYPPAPPATTHNMMMPPPQQQGRGAPTVSSISNNSYSTSTSASTSNMSSHRIGAGSNATTPSTTAATSHNPYASSSSSSYSNNSSNSTNVNNPYASRPQAPPQASSSGTSRSPTYSSTTNNSTNNNKNPYASSGLSLAGTKRSNTNSVASSTSNTNSTNNPYVSSKRAPASNNPYASSGLGPSSASSNFQNAAAVLPLQMNHHHRGSSNATSQQQQQPQPITIDLVDADDSTMASSATGHSNSHLSPRSNTTSMTISPMVDFGRSSTGNNSSNNNSSAAGQQQHQISDFSSLKAILQQIATNQQMYESYVGTTFEVPMKQKEGQGPQQSPIYFNIIKNKKWSKKKATSEEKYIYCMIATFGSQSETDVVRCQIPHSHLAPYFPLSASDTRALSRTDNPKSQQMVTEGGQRVRDEYFGLRTWHATLQYSKWDEWVQACQGSPHWNHKDTAMLIITPK
jgi:hypothetical protein